MVDLSITQEITIELDGKSPFEYVVVKQGDKDSRILSVSLLQNKQPYTIPTGCTARIKYFKPDGKPVLNNCTISGNKILITYTAQMLAAAGTAKGEIVILQGTRELKSATYYTKIVSAVYQTEGLVSDKEFLSIAETLVDMNQAADEAAENANIAEAAAASANTAAGGANTAKNAANNAATAANNAASAATNAASAANNAAGSVNAAKTAATEAASKANTATINANAATGRANSATDLANAAAATATEKAEAANTAANTANEKADLANTAASAADIARGNASAAAQSANTAAGDARSATTAATAAAAACEGIAAGINTIPDPITGKTYLIGIENGKMYLERVEG